MDQCATTSDIFIVGIAERAAPARCLGRTRSVMRSSSPCPLFAQALLVRLASTRRTCRRRRAMYGTVRTAHIPYVTRNATSAQR